MPFSEGPNFTVALPCWTREPADANWVSIPLLNSFSGHGQSFFVDQQNGQTNPEMKVSALIFLLIWLQQEFTECK